MLKYSNILNAYLTCPKIRIIKKAKFQVSVSLDLFRWLDTPGRFSAISYKGDNFSDLIALKGLGGRVVSVLTSGHEVSL